MAVFRFQETQEINAGKMEIWDFISSPQNLQQITPAHMGFQILTPNLPEKMYPGMMIEYTVKPVLGIPVKWLTEITHVKEFDFFVDEQRSGPYALWHHEHHLKETGKGILMTDIIHYAPPFGFLGAIANSLFIEKKLKAIFAFRRIAIEKKFS